MRTTYGKNLCASGGHNNGPPQSTMRTYDTMTAGRTIDGAGGHEGEFQFNVNGTLPLGLGARAT
jgi:hypothetical protein